MEKTNISIRLKQMVDYLRFKGIAATQKDLANMTGWRQPHISSALNGDSKRLTEDALRRFVRPFNNIISESWLLTGEGSMLKAETKDTDNRAEMLGYAFRASTPEEGVSSVRFFSVTPSATFQDFCCSDTEQPEYIPIIAPQGETIDDSSCVFEVHGDSMLPQIPDHAKVLCREIPPSRWHLVSDGVVVIAYADRFVIKRVVKNKLGAEDFITLGSDNPDYPATETVARADIRCMFQARQILSSPIR